MLRGTLTIAIAMLALSSAPARGLADPSTGDAPSAASVQHPKKAICQTCAAHGSDHGEEKVVAHREFEGTFYYFCNTSCAETFDGFPTAYVPQPVPRPAREVSLTGLDGAALTLGGGPQLIDFWATWCKPCTKAIPELNELHAELGPRGLDIVGVSIDEKGADHVAKFLKKNTIDYRVAVDNPEAPAWYAYAVAAIPAMFLVDADGAIVGEWRGTVPFDEVRERATALLDAGGTTDTDTDTDTGAKMGAETGTETTADTDG